MNQVITTACTTNAFDICSLTTRVPLSPSSPHTETHTHTHTHARTHTHTHTCTHTHTHAHTHTHMHTDVACCQYLKSSFLSLSVLPGTLRYSQLELSIIKSGTCTTKSATHTFCHRFEPSSDTHRHRHAYTKHTQTVCQRTHTHTHIIHTNTYTYTHM